MSELKGPAAGKSDASPGRRCFLIAAAASVETAPALAVAAGQGRRPAPARPNCRRGWGIGDKTGSGDHGTANTIALIRPRRAALVAAVYYTEEPDSLDARNAVNRQVGEIIAAAF